MTDHALYGVRAPFPGTRPRRLRRDRTIRALVAEHRLDPSLLIQPYFVIEGEDRTEAVDSMPGVSRLSIDRLVEAAGSVHALGVLAVVLFPVTDDADKTEACESAHDPDGLAQRAIRALKAAHPSLAVITDVALDPYTPHGQDGLMDEAGYIVNDETVDVLVRQALSHADAGADIVAPSDMMDGRIGAIREALEAADHRHTPHHELRGEVRLELLRPVPRRRRRQRRPRQRRTRSSIRWTRRTATRRCTRSPPTCRRAPT